MLLCERPLTLFSFAVGPFLQIASMLVVYAAVEGYHYELADEPE